MVYRSSTCNFLISAPLESNRDEVRSDDGAEYQEDIQRSHAL